jgi:hypothetical protein
MDKKKIKLPKKVDLSDKTQPILNQGEFGSSVACAMAYMMRKEKKQDMYKLDDEYIVLIQSIKEKALRMKKEQSIMWLDDLIKEIDLLADSVLYIREEGIKWENGRWVNV